MQICSFGDDQTPSLDEQLRNRVKAKFALWDFYQDILNEIINWQSTPSELTSELAKVASRILHPHFTTLEIEDEILNILNTFKAHKPEQFSSIVTAEITTEILRKLRDFQ